MKKYFTYLVFSYITALIFETIANTIGDGQLFKSPNAVVFFLVWYGLLYTVLYLICRGRPLLVPVIVLAILGSVAEIIVFKRSNLIVDPIIYAIMGFLPFWALRKVS